MLLRRTSRIHVEQQIHVSLHRVVVETGLVTRVSAGLPGAGVISLITTTHAHVSPALNMIQIPRTIATSTIQT